MSDGKSTRLEPPSMRRDQRNDPSAAKLTTTKSMLVGPPLVAHNTNELPAASTGSADGKKLDAMLCSPQFVFVHTKLPAPSMRVIPDPCGLRQAPVANCPAGSTENAV